jgi:hypothetical protein
VIEDLIMPKLRTEVKELWTAALDSGEFKQGEGVLRSVHGEVSQFCCYGVLCEIYHRQTGLGKWITENLRGTRFQAVEDGEAMMGLPPNAVFAWAFDGIPEYGPDAKVNIGGTVRRLHVHNDNKVPFVEISKAIKEQM